MEEFNLNLKRLSQEDKNELVNILNDFGEEDYEKDWSFKMLNITTHTYLSFDFIQKFRISTNPVSNYKTIKYDEFRQIIQSYRA